MRIDIPSLLAFGLNECTGVRPSGVQIEGGALVRICIFTPKRQTGRPSGTLSMEENCTSAASTTVMAPEPSTCTVLSGSMKAAVSSSRPMPTAKGLYASAVSNRPSRSRCRKCWSMMNRLVSPRPGARRTDLPRGAPLVAEGDHVLAEEGGSRAGAGYRNAARVQQPHRFATGVPPSKVESLSWLPPVKKTRSPD